MLTADKLRNENIAEYLLYMWQVEDLLRAFNLDIERLQTSLIAPSPASDNEKKETEKWYSELIDMMRLEGVREKGHLQVNNNVLIQLDDLHRMLLKSVKYPEYGAEFYRTLPIIVELRSKSGAEKSGEIETCFNALYGMLLMRLQGKTVMDGTRKAMAQITKFISMLASFYHTARNHFSIRTITTIFNINICGIVRR